MFTPSNTAGLSASGAITPAYVAVFGPVAGVVSANDGVLSAYSQSSVARSPAPLVHSSPSSGFAALQRAERAMGIQEELEALAKDIDRRGGHSPKFSMPKGQEEPLQLSHGDVVWLPRDAIASNVSRGLYGFLSGRDGAEYLANLVRPFPITSEVREALTPVGDLHKEAVEALQPGKGWKLHLNFDHTNRDVVSRIGIVLERLMGRGIVVNFKIGQGGGVECGAPGKEATVYVGHGYRAKSVAKFLHNNYSYLLKPPAGDTLVDDILMAPLIAARFDLSHTYYHDFNQYGWHGIPFVMGDGRRHSRRNGEEARAFAHAVLAARFGEFFTEGLDGSTRP